MTYPAKISVPPAGQQLPQGLTVWCEYGLQVSIQRPRTAGFSAKEGTEAQKHRDIYGSI